MTNQTNVLSERAPKSQSPNSEKYASKGCISDFQYVWRRSTELLHLAITKAVLFISLLAARNPKRCIGLISAISIALISTGMATNFELSAEDEDIFAPVNCIPREHFEWINNAFPTFVRPLILIVHAEGDNVMHYEGMRRLFNATDMIRGMEDYHTICAGSDGDDIDGCNILGPTQFWDHDSALFEEETQGSDQAIVNALSQNTVNGAPFPHSLFIGNMEREETNNGTLITSAQSFVTVIESPSWPNGESEEFELEMINLLKPVKEAWAAELNQPYRLEFYALRSVPDELTRAIYEDLPLIPCVFAIMAAFTCMIFCRRDLIQSRTLLGIGSVVTIMLSIMSGFGLAFCIGLPFTSMTSVLPFVIFGIGLDDTFIIVGAYFRTDPSKDPVVRIQETMEEVGMSISMTTITTTVAFVMGTVTSTIPIIQWLCLYAFPTICIDFVYQISFFVAIVVLDERRIKANRFDCCVCMTAKRPTEEEADSEPEESVAVVMVPAQAPVVERFMDWYCEHLLRPWVKIAVMAVFTAFVGACIYSTTLLEQEFKPTDFLPEVSYAADFLEANDLYTQRKLGILVYFRGVDEGVDQTDPEVQQQMVDYISDLAALPQIQEMPEVCWVTDFQALRTGENPALEQYSDLFGKASNLTVAEQLDLMLSVPEINEVYGPSIVRNEAGGIIGSNCFVAVNHVDLDVVKEQSHFLAEQRRVTEEQPINQSDEPNKFFSFDLIFFIWEFYTVAVMELTFTTVSGVIAVTVITFILIPHWTAAMFVFPFMCVLYIDLLGTLQFAGLHINPLTYICLVISVGLLVDFIMHIILRYYESTEKTREAKVKDTLRTMGASILVGGLSTCLGVIPLAFSSSGIIQTVFTMFIAMVSLGVGHGLILLPVILSYVGPTVCIKPGHVDSKLLDVSSKAASPSDDPSLSRRFHAEAMPVILDNESEPDESKTSDYVESRGGDTTADFSSDGDEEPESDDDDLLEVSFVNQVDDQPLFMPPRVCLERSSSFGTEYSV